MNREKNKCAVAVGIDVAKATLSVCIRYQDDTECALSIRNTKGEINERILPLLRNHDSTMRVVMESTGHYHWLTALILTEAGYDVRIVNPILAKQYTSSNIRKVKTDPADARGLARMARIADNLPERFNLDRKTLSLRKKLSLMSSTSHHLQALKSALASMEEAQEILGEEDSKGMENLFLSIDAVEKSLKQLERECIAEGKEEEEMKQRMQLLTSIPGVSEFCSVLTLNWFRLTPSVTPKSWIAYAGLDISSRESGTWKGKCRLTKRGNPFLRKRLYSAAWGAMMHDDDFKRYYDHLRETENRSHVESLVILARKIVRTMFRVIQTGEKYDESKFMHKFLEEKMLVS